MKLPGYENIPGLTERAVEQIPRFLVGIKRHWISDPVKSRVIEKALGLSGPEVRAIVSVLRTKGYPIASGSKGYWWATKPGELASTREHVQARRRRLQSVDEGLERAQNNLRAGNGLQSDSIKLINGLTAWQSMG